MKRIISILFITFISLYSLELKEGDIVYTYNSKDPIDVVLKNYLHTKYTHSYIYHNGKLWSITIDFVGDRGKLDTLDVKDILHYDKIGVYRPKYMKSNYLKCYKFKISKLIEDVDNSTINFDWLYRKKNRNLMCSEFATEPYRRCTPKHILKTDIRFPFEKELNLKYWDLIYEK